MNGAQSFATNTASPAEAMSAGNRKGGQVLSDQSVGKQAPAATFVRLDVSALAVQKKVFENLLAQQGLGSEQDATDRAFQGAENRNGRSSAFNLSTNSESGAFKREDNVQGRIATENLPRRIVAQNQSDQRNDQHDAASGLQQQSPPSMTYEFDASPEQLANIIKRIGERTESFSAPQFAENSGAAANNYNNYHYGAGAGGGSFADRPAEQQVKAGGGGVNLPHEQVAQAQAAPAAVPGSANQTASHAVGAAKQHVVFVLHVVDRLAPVAGDASRMPAPAVSAPAKQ